MTERSGTGSCRRTAGTQRRRAIERHKRVRRPERPSRESDGRLRQQGRRYRAYRRTDKGEFGSASRGEAGRDVQGFRSGKLDSHKNASSRLRASTTYSRNIRGHDTRFSHEPRRGQKSHGNAKPLFFRTGKRLRAETENSGG